MIKKLVYMLMGAVGAAISSLPTGAIAQEIPTTLKGVK
jgi:hypothetical protein